MPWSGSSAAWVSSERAFAPGRYLARVPSYLDEIIESVRARSKIARRPDEEVEAEARARAPARDFPGALKEDGISLIAEFKRSSPSAGEIRIGADAGKIATDYQKGGARALSVLTEPDYFSGSLEDLAAAKAATEIPVLRKDFIVDRYQVAEARAAGADAVLLIVAALSREALEVLVDVAAEFEIAALVEVHDERELETALGLDCALIGINQRNLRTFRVDKALAGRLRSLVPAGVVVVAESGIASREDVKALEAAGVDAILVGEALMRAPDPASAASELLGLSS